MATLSEVVVTGTAIAPNNLVPNPLSKFASYTYSWSLWYLDSVDYNTFANMPDSISSMSYKFSNKSYVLAQDGGMYPNRRVPGNPLNYNIQTVKFSTAIAPGKSNRSSTLTDGSMTILEPYGVTFIENLVEASAVSGEFQNYTIRPYLLQLEFKGYDDAGEPISPAESLFLRKRFPISIKNIKVSLTNKGAEYTIDFAGYQTKAFDPSYSSTPKHFTITAGTVKEFFDQLSNRYYEFYTQQLFLGHTQYADSVKFELDNAIGSSKIVNEGEIPLAKSNSNADGLDFAKMTFSIPAGTPILDIINRVMSHSDYILKEQLKISNLTTNSTKSDYDVFNSFKTTSRIKMVGCDQEGNEIQEGVVDSFTNRYPLKITYGIRPYPTWASAHPAMPALSSTRGKTIKEYNFYYTGKNTEIIDLKLDFDTTYYAAILGYTGAIASAESTRYTKEADDSLDPSKPKTVKPPPGAPGTKLAKVPSVTPIQYRRIVNNPNITTGMNLSSNPQAQVGADVISALQSDPAAAITLELTILGDPTLIKQDDWAYYVNPSISSQYNDFNSFTQQQFAERYGHVRTDAGELAALVTINTPMDIDVDGINQGLVDPLPGVSRSLFSGRYRILTIQNTFSNGKFEQKLSMARYINEDYASVFAPTNAQRTTDAVATNQNNQTSYTGTNTGSSSTNSGATKRE